MLEKQTRWSEKSTVCRGLCAAVVATLAVTGCAEEATDDETGFDGDSVAEVLAQQASPLPSSTLDVPNPAGAYFVSVTASGTGCPPGTWNTRIAPDGKVFTTTFAAYETSVNTTTAVAIKNCQLTVNLRSPSGHSYSVSEFSYQGYAYLEENVSARQVASYSFQGNPVAADQIRADLIGPLDDDFLFKDKIGVADTVVWSPCGAERKLNINTSLRVQNSTPRRFGKVSVSSLDGQFLSTSLIFKLDWRKCTEAPVAPISGGSPVRGGRR